jgi:tetratricopeptide (TPR) repeat protein
VFAVLLRAASSRVPFAALLSVHRQDLRGQRAIAQEGFDGSAIQEIKIARNVVPAFERAVSTRSAYIGPIATEAPEIDEQLARLGGVVPAAALVLPVTIGERTVAILVGHRGEQALAPDQVSDLFPLASVSGHALERLLAVRASAAAEKPSPSSTSSSIAVPVAEDIDEVEAQRRVLAVYREYESWAELAEAIRALVRMGLEGGEPDEDEQLELLLELGSVEADQLGRPALAVEAWRSAQTINASDERVFERLERLLAAQERWEDVIDLLERRAALAEHAQGRAFALLNAAAIAQEKLLDDGRAIAIFERIRAWAPENPVAAAKLEELYRTQGEWQRLVDLLLDVASRTADPVARVKALESAARTYEEQLGDARAAFLVWVTVLRREPQRPGGLEAIEQLGSLAGSWQELIPDCEALAGELAPADADAAARLWRQLGRWKGKHLGLAQEAADALDRAHRLAPDDVELLDELLALRREVGPWAELPPLLLRRTASQLDPIQRSDLLVELGRVHETQLGQPLEAVRAYQSALEVEPACTAALAGLRRVHAGRQAWPELAEVLTRLIDTLPDNERVVAYLELATVLGEHLGQPAQAIRGYEEALALHPGNRQALQGLAQLYRATGQTEAYLETLEADLDANPSTDQYAEVAAGWEQLGRLDRAAAAWQKLLAAGGDDEAAHQALARTLRAAGRWSELAAVHRARLQTASGPSDRIPILLTLAADLEAHDTDAAIAGCREALALEADHQAALDRLARCYQRAGRRNEALDLLERLLQRATDTRTKADLYRRIGSIHADRDEIPKALAGFTSALNLDSANALAHEAIARLYGRLSDWARAADHLRRAGLAHDDRRESIRCLGEAAQLYREPLANIEKASECLRRIVELDPDHASAKQRLAGLLAGTNQWQALWPHVREAAAAMEHRPDASPDERRDAYLQAARCALELGDSEQALGLFDRAVAVDPGHIPVLLERGDALCRSRAWEPAAKAYQTILVQHAPTLEAPHRAAAFRKLALIHRQLGHAPQTFAYYHKALEFAPRDPGILHELAELHLEQAQFDEAAGTLRLLVDVVAPLEKVPILERIADLLHEKLKNPQRATSTCLEALEIDGANRRILQKVLDLQSETGQWKAALETIARFLALESNPRRRAKYLLAAAAIRQYQLKDEAAALEDYQGALGAVLQGSDALDEAARSSALEVFQRIEELLTARHDWQGLDRACRLLLKRLPKGDPVLVRLWHLLGVVLRRGGESESAIIAFETAHSLDPDKAPERVQVLAELYALVGKQTPQKATDHAARLVDADPDNPEAYRAMGKACLEAGLVDEAWCVSRVLVFRKQARPEEEQLYLRYQPHERRKAKGVLDEETWSVLREEGEDRIVSSIFGLVWEGPVALRAGPTKSFQLKSKEKIKIEDGSRAVGKIFQNAARVLNAPLPHVYVQPERSGRLLLANCVEDGALAPTVIVARDLMAGYRDTEIAFCVASTLALLRPAWYLRLALPTSQELEAALIAAIGLVRGDVTTGPELAPLVESFSAEMQKRVTRQTLEVLRGLVGRFTGRPNLARWRDAVDAGARRAGLLVCGELEAAARMASTEPVLRGGPQPRDKVQDLVVFSVSPAYFAARRKLGVAVA